MGIGAALRLFKALSLPSDLGGAPEGAGGGGGLLLFSLLTGGFAVLGGDVKGAEGLVGDDAAESSSKRVPDGGLGVVSLETVSLAVEPDMLLVIPLILSGEIMCFPSSVHSESSVGLVSKLGIMSSGMGFFSTRSIWAEGDGSWALLTSDIFYHSYNLKIAVAFSLSISISKRGCTLIVLKIQLPQGCKSSFTRDNR